MANTNLWWLSFADDHKHLGVAIVAGGNIAEAAIRAHAAGCNPGGEVVGIEIPERDRAAWLRHTDKLLTKYEAEALAKQITGEGTQLVKSNDVAEWLETGTVKR
jgi:hypothetical protein